MKKQAVFLFLPIFLVFFVWGLQVGNNLEEKLPVGMTNQPYDLEKNIISLPSGQKSIFIIVVSQLDTQQPELLGIWLMSYMPSQPYVTMLAVYPPLNQNGDGTYIRLVDNFQLRSANGIPQLEDEFMIILNESNIWSSGYLLVDVDGLAQLFMMSDGKADLSVEVNDEIIIDQISRLTEPSSSTLVIQTLVLQHICNTFTLVNSIPELKLIKDIFPDHISSNIDPEILLQDWQQFINSRNGSFCVFPQEESILLNYQ